MATVASWELLVISVLLFEILGELLFAPLTFLVANIARSSTPFGSTSAAI
jgi:hypothetical protein